MRNIIADESISLVKSIDDIHNIVDSIISSVSSVKNANELIDVISITEKEIRNLESIVSLLPMRTNNLMTLYGNYLNSINSIKNQLLESVSEKENSNSEILTFPSITDGDDELTLSDIIIESDPINPETFNVMVDTVLDRKEYSCLSLIKRLKNENLAKVYDYAMTTLAEFLQIVNEYKSKLLVVKSTISDSEKISEIYDDGESNDMTSLITNGVNGYSYRLGKSRSDIYKLFQMMNAIEDNYVLFQKAVSAFSQITTESFFNAYSTYELL